MAGGAKGRHRPLEVGTRPCISSCYLLMDFSTRALSAADVLFAVQVDRLPWAARANTAAWMPHTLAATLIGAMTDMGMLLTLTCRPLATLLRTLVLTSCTLTSGPMSSAA